jgi:hypothetical protein
LHQPKSGHSVSKSYVAYTLRDHQLELLRMRREIRSRKPANYPKNRAWAMDLTSVDQKPILGILDQGTRVRVALELLSTRRSIDILIVLLIAIRDFGNPKTVKTDNERIFCSWLFRVECCRRPLHLAPSSVHLLPRTFFRFPQGLRWRLEATSTQTAEPPRREGRILPVAPSSSQEPSKVSDCSRTSVAARMTVDATVNSLRRAGEILPAGTFPQRVKTARACFM